MKKMVAPVCHGRSMILRSVQIPVYFFQCHACGAVQWTEWKSEEE